MLALKFMVLVLVVSHGVLGRETRRGNIRHQETEEEYKYNHPPAPENYDSIPVAVVYEEEVDREDKSIKNIKPANGVEQVNKNPLKSEASVTKEPSRLEVNNDKHIDTTPPDIEPKVTTYRPQKEQQISVAVVYDPESTSYQKPRPNGNRITNKRRKIQRPALEDEPTDAEDNISSNAQVNGHTGVSIVNKQEYLNKRRKIQRPESEEKQTTVEDHVSSIKQANQYASTTDDDKLNNLNNRKILQRPVSERTQITVEDNYSYRVRENQNTQKSEDKQTAFEGNLRARIPEKINSPSTFTANYPEVNGRQNIQRPVLEKVQSNVEDNISTLQENENTAYISTNKKLEEFNTRRTVQRPVTENKGTTVEDNYNSEVQKNKNTLKSENVNSKTESSQEFSKRGNSSRIQEVIPIIQSENILFSQSGNFQYSYEGGDGTKAFETGELRTFDDESAGEAVSGGFSYTAKDGNEYSLSYTADENGYRPVGAHLPTPPPIPPAIARALAHLATKTTPEPITVSIAEYDQ